MIDRKRMPQWASSCVVALWAVAAILLLAGCAQDVPPSHCDTHDCHIGHAVKTLAVIRSNIAYWVNLNLIGQAAIVVFGIIATVMIAMQGDKNKHWTRPIGLVSTALVTGITSALVSFHVPDNIDKLIDVYGKIAAITNEYDYRVRVRQGKAGKDEMEALTKKYADEFNAAKLEMLRLGGTAARLNAVRIPAEPARK